MDFLTLKAPFIALHDLLDSIPAGDGVINLAIGEPKHAPPDFVRGLIETGIAEGGLSRYPPTVGTDELRDAIASWLARRFDVVADPARHILPVCGTREALFLIGICAARFVKKKDAVMFMPDPGYQSYIAAALGAGCEPILLAADRTSGFLPDLDFLEDQLKKHYAARAVAFYLCSPANPQGAAADMDYLKRCVHLAATYNFIMIADECYSELYAHEAPPSILNAAEKEGFKNVMAFHSLSKRSNLPGLRSGFCAGDSQLVAHFRIMRELGAVSMPLPTQHASAAVWSDDAHVAKNRALYREKFDLAEKVFGAMEGFYRPAGGFFLWFDVSPFNMDGEQMAVELWRAGVRVLPGSYLSQQQSGREYLRIALVAEKEVLAQAFTRMEKVFYAH